MFDSKSVKLGKKPPKLDARTLKLGKYVDALPSPPPSCDWTKGVTSFGMMDNDLLGDCVCAMCGHGVQIATLNSPDNEVTPPDSTILSLYENACGYVPGNASTDQGCVIIDTLNWVRQNIPWTHKDHPIHHHPYELIAYADPDLSDVVQIKQAIATFGTLGVGLQLPLSAQIQTGSVWDVVGNPNSDPNSAPGSWGGHAVIVCGYTPTTLTCITWGALQLMSWEFFSTYVDEAHMLLFRAWLGQFGAQQSEMLAQLEADLKLISD
jgi:hypothetical protein